MNSQKFVTMTKFFVLFLFAVVSAKQLPIVNYNGYQMMTIQAHTKEQFQFLHEFYERNQMDLDFWKPPKEKGATDVLVPPSYLEQVHQFIKDTGLSVKVQIPDVGAEIAKQKINAAAVRAKNEPCWIEYCDLEQYYEYLEGTSVNSYVTLEIPETKSFEGRDIPFVKISKDGPNSTKPIIFIDALHHSREWVAGASALWMINQLLNTGNTVGTPEYELLNNYDIYFLPVVNPDGYSFTHTNDRMWRKTRSKHSGSICVGTDPNRNYDHHFGGPGTSPLPCSDIYHGPEPFSESETTLVKNLITNIIRDQRRTIHAYVTIHSYSQYILLPFGHEYGEYSDNHEEQMSWASNTVERIQNLPDSKFYEHGSVADVIYRAAGGSIDWVQEEFKVKYTVAYEARPSAGSGGNGFLLPASEIVPASEDLWAGILLFNEHKYKA